MFLASSVSIAMDRFELMVRGTGAVRISLRCGVLPDEGVG